MRQPHSVLVFPFRRTEAEPTFAILRRSDDSNWQCVAGGVEDDESLSVAARRETFEETGFSGSPLYKLDMASGVGKHWFSASSYWPDDLYIVRKHFFAMDVTSADTGVSLSSEHSKFQWVSYEAAASMLRYDDDKTALWELFQRIQRNDLNDADEGESDRRIGTQ